MKLLLTMTTTLVAESTDDLNNMERLIDAEVAVLSIAKFLSAKDCLSLHAVSKRFHTVVSKHDEALFENHLRHDFPEGKVLIYVAEKKNLSCKKLYRAFLGRWSLPRQADEKIRAPLGSFGDFVNDRKTKIMISWLKPPDIPADKYEGANLLIPNDDVDNVIFIVRVGAVDADSCCALMEWNSEHDPEKSDHRSQLILDRSWCDHNKGEGMHLPQDREAEEWMYGEINVGQLTEALKSKHSLALHAIDIRYCQVASLMENSPLEELSYNKTSDVSKFTSFYGFGLPSLWGIRPKFSPLRRELTNKDFDYFWGYGLDEDEGPPPLEYLPIRGKLQINCSERVPLDGDGEESFDLDLYHPQKGLNFTFLGDGEFDQSSVSMPHQICNFLRALMKEKCLEVEPWDIMQFAVVTQQPDWVQVDKVLDTITSYAPFEDQAGKLRLVCRQFDASALRQIEAKLDKTKVIGFTRGGGEGCECGSSWFKATVRRGWSDTCLTSKESAIDDALWLASCRCCFEYCADKESCKNASKPLNCLGHSSDAKKSETQSIDVGILRQKLADTEGRVRLTEESPDDIWERCDYWEPSNVVECSFKEDEMTLFELCHIAGKVIDSKTGGRYEYEETGRRGRLNRHLKRDYGVSKSISSRQFVRSIFLIFVRAATKTALDQDKSSAVKKARIAPSRKVTIGMAKSTVEVKGGSYSRMKKIMRFHSADNEPVEICFESRSSYVY